VLFSPRWTLRALFGRVAFDGASVVHITAWRGAIIEALVTALLVVVILNTAHKHSLIGTEAALAVGATLLVCHLLAGEFTSASLNPARSLGSGDRRRSFRTPLGCSSSARS
jgi:aquaporin Z